MGGVETQVSVLCYNKNKYHGIREDGLMTRLWRRVFRCNRMSMWETYVQRWTSYTLYDDHDYGIVSTQNSLHLVFFLIA